MVADERKEESSFAENGRITVNQVTKQFQDSHGGAVVALEQISIDIHPGEFISLIGPSGCGKSTFLRLVAGLDTPTEGELKLDGIKIDQPHYTRGFVFQDPTLFPWLTVEKNVSVGLQARNILKEKKHEVEQFIKLVGLQGFETAYPFQLSGGMAQRAALARTLINHPKVLLLDEPLGALDAFTRMNMQDELLRIWQERSTTMIMVTHDIDEAIYMSDRIVIMSPRPGRIKKIYNVPLARPRARNHPDFLKLRTKILEILHFADEKALEQSYHL